MHHPINKTIRLINQFIIEAFLRPQNVANNKFSIVGSTIGKNTQRNTGLDIFNGNGSSMI